MPTESTPKSQLCAICGKHPWIWDLKCEECLDAQDQISYLTDKLCKIQDDIASLVSSHRSDWSWNDVIEDVKKLVEKQIVNEVTIGWLTKIVREQKGIIDLQTEVIEDLLKQK